MPIYEYICSKCGDHLEVIQKMDDKPLSRCAKCKGRLQKAVSRSSFAFKGSGWYVTDYAKSGSASPEAKAKAKAESTSKGEASKSSDASAKPDSSPVKSDASAPAASTPGKSKSD